MVVLGVSFRKLDMRPGYVPRFQAQNSFQLSQKKGSQPRLERDRGCKSECHFGVLQSGTRAHFLIGNFCLPLCNLRCLLSLWSPLNSYASLVLKNHQIRPKGLENCFFSPDNDCFFALHRLLRCRDLLVLDIDKSGL